MLRSILTSVLLVGCARMLALDDLEFEPSGTAGAGGGGTAAASGGNGAQGASHAGEATSGGQAGAIPGDASGGEAGAIAGGASSGGEAGATAGGASSGGEAGATAGGASSGGEAGAIAGGSDLPVHGEFQPPSCEPALECAGEDCCAALLVPSGNYLMGRGSEYCPGCTNACPEESEGHCWPDEQPEHLAGTGTFYLDRFEVTVGRFRRFVDDYDRWHTRAGLPAPGDGEKRSSSATGWQEGTSLPRDSTELFGAITCKDNSSLDSWTGIPADNENLPMNCVDWSLAFAFCIWDGGRLPTEAEWERAAAGGDQNRLYPWGSEAPTDDHANFWRGPDESPERKNVGIYPLGDGRYGHSDLGGSMFEWVFDSYSAYRDLPDVCDDCVNLTGTGRVIRGGAWTVESWFMRSTSRLVPVEGGALRNDNLGFRCARDVPAPK